MSESLPPKRNRTITVDESDHYKIVQALYASVTGKTEKLSRSFSNEFILTSDNLKQLNYKCLQASSQWDVVSTSSNITIHHVDENKEVFSSIDRFEAYDISRANATESIVYELNLLLRLPKVEKEQPYKVTVRAMSRVAMLDRMHKDMLPPAFMRFFISGNLIVEITYVDYVVARNLMGVLDSWVSEIEREPSYPWLKPIQRYSHWCAPISQLTIISLVALGLYHASPMALQASSTPSELAQWLILGGTVITLSSLLARRLGGLLENGIDEILALSVIQMNKGDERLLAKFKKRNKLKFVKAIGSFTLITIQCATSNSLTNWLVSCISK